ncbi:MAG: DUF434 domain-containing protein [Spirochaetales bacterium]|nr:DUF434 domain-containing protein [Spirochaetales bacterium]
MKNNFRQAVTDYRYLKNKNYSDKSSLKLVGDRYRLSKIERNCLLRGIVDTTTSIKRKNKLIGSEQIAHQHLGIDWYNVLITIESYLKGHFLFLADDGVIRDTSAIHGSYRQSKITERAIEIIGNTLVIIKPKEMSIAIDSPISHSKEMADDLRRRFNKLLTMPCFLSLAHSADFELKRYRGVVASSDSVIMDSAEKIFDLAHFSLHTYFQFQPKPLDEYIFHE